jgi:hypothetical protein
MKTALSSYDFAEAVGLIATAQKRAERGGAIDIRDLPERIERICQALKSMPREQASGYLGLMEKLIDDLDTLQAKLGAHRAAMQRRLADLESETQAGGD